MTQRQRLENIIIGTMLDITDHYQECKSSITVDMFQDDRNRRIYEMITEMRSEGTTQTDPHSILKRYGEQVLELLPYMCEVCTEYSFEWQKVKYNERIFLSNLLTDDNMQPTGVEFDDYVNRFLELVINDEKTTDNRREFAA